MKTIKTLATAVALLISGVALTSCNKEKGQEPDQPATGEAVTTVYIPILNSEAANVVYTATLEIDGKTFTYDVAKDGTPEHSNEGALKAMETVYSKFGQGSATCYALPAQKSTKSAHLSITYKLRDGYTPTEKMDQVTGYYYSTTGFASKSAIAAQGGLAADKVEDYLAKRTESHTNVDLRVKE